MFKHPKFALNKLFACLFALAVLSACSDSDSKSSSVQPDGTISGSAIKGVLYLGQIEAYQTDSSDRKLLVGSAQTDQFGNFDLNFNSEFDPENGLVLLELKASDQTLMTCDVLPGCTIPSSGEYASFGEQFNVPEDFQMLGVFDPALNEAAYITPISHLIVASALSLPEGLTEANVSQASSWAQSDLGLEQDPLTVKPLDLTQLPAISQDTANEIGEQNIRQTLIGASLLETSLSNEWSENEVDFNDVEVASLISSASGQAQSLQTFYEDQGTAVMPPAIEQILVTAGDSLGEQEDELTRAEISVLMHPQSQSASEGESVVLRAAATSSSGNVIGYQWFKDGQLLNGETNAQLELNNSSIADTGVYWVEFRSDSIVLVSSSANILISEPTLPPTISQQPASQNLTSGQSLLLEVTASGSGTLQYNWQKGGSLLPGETGPTLRIDSSSVADSGSYRVSISNEYGQILSDIAVVNIIEPITPVSIVEQPQSQTSFEGATASLSVVAVGGGFVGYQWYKNGVEIQGATGDTLNLLNLSLDDGGNYFVYVSNSQGGLSSNVATLTVLELEEAPQFTQQPSSLSVNAGSTASFSAIVSSSSTVQYQWYKDGIALSGSTSNTLNITNASEGDNGNYYVIATNSAGSTQSQSAALTVSPTDPSLEIVSQPADQSVQQGNSASFTVELLDDTGASYQWYFNSAAIPGATESTYTISNSQLSDAGFYQVIAQNLSGLVVSSEAELQVNAFSTLELSWGIPTQRANGEPLSVDEIGGYVIEYGYDASNLDRVVNISGAQTTSLTLEDLSSGQLYLRIATVDSENVVGEFTAIVSIIIP